MRVAPYSRTSLADRARAYVAKIPPAVSGQGGHPQTFSVACALVHGFALPRATAWPIFVEYCARCSPPWNLREAQHKMDSAEKATSHTKPRGHLAGPSAKWTWRRKDWRVKRPPPEFVGRVVLPDLPPLPTPTPPTAAPAAPRPRPEPPPRSPIPPAYCPTCWTRWARALAVGRCACTGSAEIGTLSIHP